jgi:hypothetical protein
MLRMCVSSTAQLQLHCYLTHVALCPGSLPNALLLPAATCCCLLVFPPSRLHTQRPACLASAVFLIHLQPLLSTHTGAILVNPWNINDVAAAIEDALTMSEEERRERHRQNYMHVATHTAQVCLWVFGRGVLMVCWCWWCGVLRRGQVCLCMWHPCFGWGGGNEQTIVLQVVTACP